MRSGVSAHLTATVSTRDGRSRIQSAVLSTYVVRVHWLSFDVVSSPKSSVCVMRPAVFSNALVLYVVRQSLPAPSSSEVQVRVEAVPVRLAVTVPQERVRDAV